ncbi:pyruvate kinase PKM-like [Aplysia californica]|uniref:Pyruvate kinase n=1 Tax=Aplysia californica TaxID=6500 RepID=A0ABM1W4S0_APLCA|nr:pyruvate kinase PKM [Aplysia californica]XP_035829663.1 pyruvate kinase PKM-like [Aplysia californica]
MALSLAKPGPSGKPLVTSEQWREMIIKLTNSPQAYETRLQSKPFPKEEQFQCLLCDSLLEHNINLDIDSVANKNKLMKIICTIGPASREVDKLEQLIKAGMNICRLNFSHGTYEYHAGTVENVRQAAAKMPRGQVLGVALDTKGPEIRTGLVKGEASSEVVLETGKTIRLTINDEFKEKCSAEVLWCDYKNLLKTLDVGGLIYIDDGLISLRAKEKTSDSFICDIVNGGSLGSKKGCNLPGTPLDLPAVSEKDKQDLLFGLEKNVDMVFASFIQSGNCIRQIREVLGEKGKNIKIMSKIESFSGLWNFMDVLEETDGVMVARGDMGIEIPPEKVFVAQKLMISACNKAGKPVICATQMLESMTYKPRATRAESNDVANAVLDGADSVMLSGESAKGLYPVEAVAHMAAVCKEAEAVFFNKRMFQEMRNVTPMFTDATQAIALAAVDVSYQCQAKAILTLSMTGRTAYLMSMYRPRCPVIMVTSDPLVARQSLLYRCLVPYLYEGASQSSWEDDLNHRVSSGLEMGMAWGHLKFGDVVILVVGLEKGSGNTNSIQIITCPHGKHDG